MMTMTFAVVVIVIIVIIVAVGLVLLVRTAEPGVAFFPVSGETVQPGGVGLDFTAFSIATRDKERLRGWTPQAPEAQVVYFHGNGGNLSIWTPILAGIAAHRYSLLAFDYRGYGDSTGRPGERGLYRDVDAVLERFWITTPQRRPVVYWGRSLGAVMAAYAATVRAPDGVILESGFPDARSLVRSSPLLAFLALFSSYRFPCSAFLSQVHVPVLVIHGDADHVVPFELGRRVFDSVVGDRQFIAIRGGDHNDVVPADPQAYWSGVSRFVRGLAARSDP